MSARLQTVHIRVNDSATGQPTPCRVRFTGADGTYYAPLGRLTEFATGVGEDVGGNLCLPDGTKWAYTDGAFEIQLPPGQINVEIRKGFEYRALGETLDLKPGQLSLRLNIERWIDARSNGWYSGDIHAEYLTPHAALLEAACEDLAVVNLLARATYRDGDQSLAAIPNILAFSGQQPALEVPGHFVAVNTVNWHKRLGELLLLNCHRVVYPLAFGEPVGPDNWTLADWCDQCHRKGGLVIGDEYHALAELILGKVDAVRVVRELREDESLFMQQRYVSLLNCGVRLPVVAGSRKVSNQHALGEQRTYAHLSAGQECTYRNWIEAVRAGRTYVTNGPMILLSVNGQTPGAVARVEKPIQFVHTHIEAASTMPIKRLFIVTSDDRTFDFETDSQPAHTVDIDIPFSESGWVLAYSLGDGQSAQTSPVYVEVAGQPLRPNAYLVKKVTEELNALLEWVHTNGRFEDERQRDRLAGVFLTAKGELARRANR